MSDRITNDVTVSCYSSSEAKAKAYQQIRREIDALEVAIRALKTRHNSLNVTARLPDELLGKIFECNAESLRGAERLPWNKVAFVCSDWRRVALAQPRLWSCIRHVPIELVPALLPLSGAVPLDLDIVAYHSSVERTTQVLLSVMHRIRRFRLENPRYPTQIEEILSVMANPAPLLESLELHSLPRKRASILPDNLFGGVAPRLQALDLHGWFLSPDSWHILPTLTTLKMDYLSNLNGGPSLFELIKLLEMAPNIQNLSLSSVHRDTSTPIPDEYTVRLHNLRQLRICDTLSRCTDVIERLRYPILTQFTLRIHSQSGYDNDHYGGYIASLQRIGGLAAACMAPLCSLQLRRESYGVYGLEGWTQRYAHLHAPVDVPNMKIIISCFPDPPTAHDPDKHYFSGSIRAIWEVLPKTNLECIYLEGTIFSRQIFQEAFGDNPSLRTISIADDESEVVEKGIPRKRDTERTGAVLLGHDALKFRSLQTLVIKEWNFHEYRALEATALWHCASTRQANGATLRALHILKSVGFEQLHCKEQAEVTFAIDSIREIVSEVYWDVQDKAAAV